MRLALVTCLLLSSASLGLARELVNHSNADANDGARPPWYNGDAEDTCNVYIHFGGDNGTYTIHPASGPDFTISLPGPGAGGEVTYSTEIGAYATQKAREANPGVVTGVVFGIYGWYDRLGTYHDDEVFENFTAHDVPETAANVASRATCTDSTDDFYVTLKNPPPGATPGPLNTPNPNPSPSPGPSASPGPSGSPSGSPGSGGGGGTGSSGGGASGGSGSNPSGSPSSSPGSGTSFPDPYDPQASPDGKYGDHDGEGNSGHVSTLKGLSDQGQGMFDSLSGLPAVFDGKAPAIHSPVSGGQVYQQTFALGALGSFTADWSFATSTITAIRSISLFFVLLYFYVKSYQAISLAVKELGDH